MIGWHGAANAKKGRSQRVAPLSSSGHANQNEQKAEVVRSVTEGMRIEIIVTMVVISTILMNLILLIKLTRNKSDVVSTAILGRLREGNGSSQSALSRSSDGTEDRSLV